MGEACHGQAAAGASDEACQEVLGVVACEGLGHRTSAVASHRPCRAVRRRYLRCLVCGVLVAVAAAVAEVVEGLGRLVEGRRTSVLVLEAEACLLEEAWRMDLIQDLSCCARRVDRGLQRGHWRAKRQCLGLVSSSC